MKFRCIASKKKDLYKMTLVLPNYYVIVFLMTLDMS